MKKYIMIIIAAGLMGTMQVSAQRDGGQRPPRGGQMGAQTENQSLTDDQKSAVKTILAQYDAQNLTSEQALKIHEAFQQLKIGGGRDLAELLTAAGYDPQTLRNMMPQPGSNSSSSR
ncbi:MAG: hypothetical protein EOL87_15480 [Spartobacteria bacterium]|nr:hypothetical protein [Spartobacteria bacterium]